MPRSRVNGVDLYYEVSGDGPPLLFVNGSASSIEDVRPVLTRLGSAFTVAIADSRGMGRSAVPENPYTIADLARDHIHLADKLGWDEFMLMGISFGGMVAQEIAVTVPERIRRLALLCTSSGGAGGSSYPIHELAQLPPEERSSRAILLMDERFTPAWLADHPAEQATLLQLTSRQSQIPSADALKGAELQHAARKDHDVYERLPRITCPVIVAAGRYDGIAPPRNGLALASQIPDSTFRVYEGGHGFFLQDPSALPDIMRFLAGETES